MPRTISADTTIGITLSNSTDNPVTVTATIDTTAGNALSGLAPTAWSISNRGVVETAATLGNGIQLAAGGSIANATGAQILGGRDGIYVTNAAATVGNAGTIAGATGDGVALNAGGAVSVAATGTLSAAAAGIAISGASGMVTNAGGDILASGSTAPGVFLGAGGSVSNAAGGTIGTGFGVYIAGAAGTIDNAGQLRGDRNTGVEMNAGGTLTNESSGTITGHYSGVHIQGGAGTAFTGGSIAGSNGSGILLDAGGLVSVADGGIVTGSGNGLSFAGALATLGNAGSISGGQDGVGVFAGGTLTNAMSGVISGYVGVYASTSSAAVAVVNTGSILSTGNFAIDLGTGGAVTNQAGGTIGTGEFGVAIAGAAGTVENAGSIGAAGAGDAVRFAAGFGNLLRVDPGAAFGGTVDGGNTLGAASVSTIELASGASAGTLAGLGTAFTNFGAIQFDAGARWSISGPAAALTGGQSISGFAPGDTIELAGVSDTIAGFAAGKLTLAGAAPLTLDLPGAFSVTQFHAATVSGNTDLTVTAALKQVLSGTYGSSITLNSAAYTNPITVTGTIDISDGSVGGIALRGSSPVAWTVDNQGLIEISGTGSNAVRLDAGGAIDNAAASKIIGNADGIDVLAAAGNVTNAGAIIGVDGTGVLLAGGGTLSNASSGTIGGSTYGVDIETTLRAVHNAGLIAASRGTAVLLHVSGVGAAYVGNSGSIIGSADGIDVADNSGSVSNSGHIAGDGGYGVRLALAGDVTNAVSGTITGAGKDAIRIDGAGGVFNYGSIGATGSGASGLTINGPGNLYNVAGGRISGVMHGVAIVSGPGAITNAGSIVGNGPTTGGVALDGGGALTNQASGYIAGGYGVYVSGGGTVTNAGTIKSTAGIDTAVDFVGGNPNRLVVDPGAVFIGVANGGNTAGSGAVSVLELAGGSGSLRGVGSSFVNFGAIVIDAGADWTISGSADSLANGQPISGFARGDTIELDSVATTGSAFQNGTLTLANGLQLDLPDAGYTFDQFQVTNDGTNTEVGIAVACFAAVRASSPNRVRCRWRCCGRGRASFR